MLDDLHSLKKMRLCPLKPHAVVPHMNLEHALYKVEDLPNTILLENVTDLCEVVGKQ